MIIQYNAYKIIAVIILLLKQMSGHIKHRFSNQIDVFQQHQKDADNTYSKRSSLNIPDYSAVTDNQNNRFQTDTNEISWLDKFAQDN